MYNFTNNTCNTHKIKLHRFIIKNKSGVITGKPKHCLICLYGSSMNANDRFDNWKDCGEI